MTSLMIYDTCTNDRLWPKTPHLNESWSISLLLFILILILKLTKSSFFEDPRNYSTWIRLCNTLWIDIDLSYLVKWGCGIGNGNGRDSSAGRAEDWKSSCHQFKSGSWHMINFYESLFLQSTNYFIFNINRHIYSFIV